MSSEWFYASAGQRFGPVTETEFANLRETGEIGMQTLVWREGMAEWKPLSAALAMLAPDGSYCTVCGQNVGAGNLIAFQGASVCANCKDGFFRQIREQGHAPVLANARFGGFWIRLLARFLDGLIIGAVTVPLLFAVAALTGVTRMTQEQAANPAIAAAFFGWWSGLNLLVLVLQAIYEAWFLAKRGGTPGKLILGLSVVRPDGSRITMARGFGRYFASLLSGWLLMIGYIIAAFDAEKRSLHDRICDTRVIYKRA